MITTSIMTASDFHSNPPCNFNHPRNIDWTARTLELQGEMTNSDAQGKADLEYRQGKLPTFSEGSEWKNAAVKYLKSLK